MEIDCVLSTLNHLSDDVENESGVKVGEGISGWVALTGVNVLVKNIETDTRFAKRNNMKYSSKIFYVCTFTC